MMPGRKAHKKSRGGCTNCKQRRVKCNEQKPSCDKCISRDITCTYLPSTRLVWVRVPEEATTSHSFASNSASHQPSNESSPSPKSSPQNDPRPCSTFVTPAPLSLEGMDLMIHWFTTTVHTVVATSGPNAAALELCQTVILTQAQKHHFLLHGLLALSALHLADTQTSLTERERYTRLATAHHNQGLALYHSILEHLDEWNCAASIAFSSLTAMFTFGLYRPDEEAAIEVIDDLCQIFLLAKGWGKVVGVADRLECTVGRLPLEPKPGESDCLDEETERAFERLHDLNSTRSREGDVEAYTLAIDSLKCVFREISGMESGTDPHISMAWTAVLPEKCIRLFRERQVLALVLLAYYCVVLERAPRTWWLQGWSKGLLKVIKEIIGLEYQDELKWAEDRVV